MTNTYGDAAGVAAYVYRYTVAGSFTTATRPTLAQVNTWLDQVSAQVNAILANDGFSIPITQADCVLLLRSFVESEVAEMVKMINGLGRFNSEKENLSPMKIIMNDAADFIITNRAGLAGMGASQDVMNLGDIVSRSTDESGDEVQPIFQREAFGGTNRNWDK